MKLSLSIGGAPTFSEMLGTARAAATHGLDGVWLNQVDGWDAFTAVAALAPQVPGLHWGTAVVPTFPRHPLVLAGQALTAQAASGNHFTLGIGPSHPGLIEGPFGLSYARPAAHTREYLEVLRPLLAGESVDRVGEWFTVRGAVTVPDTPAPSVLISALGPRMLELAGQLADGTFAVWVRPEHVRNTLRPLLSRAADAAGRPAPDVVVGVIAVVTDDADRQRSEIAGALGMAGDLPSYRALLDRQGLHSVTDTVVMGPEDEVAAAIEGYRAAGVDELVISTWGPEPVATWALLGRVRAAG